MILSFKVFGNVQGVMFRQTFIRGLLKRNLSGGATNIKDKEKTVNITIEAASESEILLIINEILTLRVLNSWKATVEKIQRIEAIQINDHQITTKNVDHYKWTPGVEFYF